MDIDGQRQNMNITNLILPQIESRHKQSAGGLRKGITSKLAVWTTQSLKLSDLMEKFQHLRMTVPELDGFLKTMTAAVEKLKAVEEKEKEMQSRALRAEEKVRELRQRMKKMDVKYSRDISEVVKMKILSEFSHVDNSNMFKICNYSDIQEKLSEIIKPDTFLFTEISASNDVNFPSSVHTQIDNIHFQGLKAKDNEVEILKQKINALEIEIDYLKSKEKARQEELKHQHDTTMEASQTLSPNPLGCEPDQIIEPSYQEKELLTLQRICQSYKEECQMYKNQCLNKQFAELYMHKALLMMQLIEI